MAHADAAAVVVFLEVVTVVAAQVLHHMEVHAFLEMAAVAAAHWQVLCCVGLDWRGWVLAYAESPCIYGTAAPGMGGQHKFQEQIFWHCIDTLQDSLGHINAISDIFTTYSGYMR